MQQVALSVHLLFAGGLTIGIIGLTLAGFLKKTINHFVDSIKLLFIAVATSGFLLVVIKPSSVSHVCISMAAVTMLSVIAASFYEKRTIRVTSSA